MKYSIFLFFSIVILNINCDIKSQNPVEVNIHLNEEINSKSRFFLKYEFGGKGENGMETTLFETKLDITLISSKNDTFYYLIESDSKKSSNQEALQDGEALIIYTLLGTKMEVAIDEKGKIIEIINKNDIIDKLTNNSKNQNDIIKRWVTNARKENEAMFFESIYKLNYEPLLKYTKVRKTLPSKIETDSTIVETLENPESYYTTKEDNTKSGNLYEFKKLITINSKELVQKEELYEMIIKPSKSTTSEILNTDKNGLVENLTIISKTIREGTIMKSNGKILNESGVFTEDLKVTYEKE